MAPISPSAVIQHVQSVSALLHAMRKSDGKTFEAVLAKQQQPLTNTIRLALADLHVQDIAPIVRELSTAALPDDFRQELLLLIGTGQSIAGGAGSKFQDWESLWAFCTTSVCTHKGSQQFSPAFMKLILGMGLRKPSECTYKQMSLILLVGAEGLDRALTYSPKTRKGLLDSVKP